MNPSSVSRLSALPAELTILIFTHLPLSALAKLQRVNRHFSAFVAENESTVYRNTACVEGWIPSPKTQLAELRVVAEHRDGEEDNDNDVEWRSDALYSRRAMHGVQGWKDFCRRRKTIPQAWSARAPSTILSSPRSQQPLPVNTRTRNPHQKVHRIKVDEKAGLIMTTTGIGGLVVRDLETDNVLWELPTSYVPQYAHLEYDRGYMIFSRDDGTTEVWRRTADTSPSILLASQPDQQQLQMAKTLSDTNPKPCTRAQFTPYALLVSQEPTRASRFVYPTFLASSLERTFLWDVPTGQLIQTLEGIQLVLPLPDLDTHEDAPEDHAGDDDEGANPDDNDGDPLFPVPPNPTDISDVQLALANQAIIDYHDASVPFYHMSALSPVGSSDDDDDDSDSEVSAPAPSPDEDAEDDEDEDMLPRFLGLIRYVEVSERHVVIVGRYLLRVFSRATGRAILDIPSTHSRYGAVRWEVVSAAWAQAAGVSDAESSGEKGKGKCKLDTYEAARAEGRELVRMPLNCIYKEWSRPPKLVIDQFKAAHLSSDGQHLVALLNGMRLIILPYFETLSTANPTTSPSVDMNTPSTSTAPSSNSNGGQRQDACSADERREAHRRLRYERDQELFARTFDVQLGAPRSGNSVYLAYEHGQIGVVTTNAVYIVTPNIPSPNDNSIPNLTVSRAPFFSNPSWLNAVSCLMMSDTGMYLNWNPALAVNAKLARNGNEMDDERDDHGEDGEEGESLWEKWEKDYQCDLDTYESNEAERYHTLPRGDLFVAANGGGNVQPSHLSTVYTINFAPRRSEESASWVVPLLRRSS